MSGMGNLSHGISRSPSRKKSICDIIIQLVPGVDVMMVMMTTMMMMMMMSASVMITTTRMIVVIVGVHVMTF